MLVKLSDELTTTRMRSRAATWLWQLYLFAQEMGTLVEGHSNLLFQNASPRMYIIHMGYTTRYLELRAQYCTFLHRTYAQHWRLLSRKLLPPSSRLVGTLWSVLRNSSFWISGFFYMKSLCTHANKHTDSSFLTISAHVLPLASHGRFASPRKWARL